MTLDKIFTEAKRLNNDDFEILLNGMLTEQKDRKDKEKREAWNQVWEAICFYTDRYGDIHISNDRPGYHQLILSADAGFQSPGFGNIEIT